MQKIGFTLFTEMLEEAVAAIKDGRAPSVDLEPAKAVDINLRIPALIPDDYLPDVHIRLIMYKRISACKDADELRDLQVEMIDRFGMLPKPLQLLFRVTNIKLAAQGFGINKIDANASTGRLEFKQETKVDGLSLIELVQEQPQLFKFSGPSQLNFTHNAEVPDDKLDFIEALLARLRLNA
jgi:transcription-repair coupling factor (superfamily II helicase)